jgi:hypothetical protein
LAHALGGVDAKIDGRFETIMCCLCLHWANGSVGKKTMRARLDKPPSLDAKYPTTERGKGNEEQSSEFFALEFIRE